MKADSGCGITHDARHLDHSSLQHSFSKHPLASVTCPSAGDRHVIDLDNGIEEDFNVWEFLQDCDEVLGSHEHEMLNLEAIAKGKDIDVVVQALIGLVGIDFVVGGVKELP